jgi:hypothetical protein
LLSDSSNRQNSLSECIEDGDVEDGPVLAHEGVGEDGAKDGGEVADGGEGVVEDGGHVFVEVQHLVEEQREDS